MACKILVVDDSAAIPKVIRIAFSKYQVEVIAAASFVDALAELKEQKVHLLIVDAGMFGEQIVAELQRLQRQTEDVPVILLSGSHEVLDTDQLSRSGFRNILRKPFEASDITGLAEDVLGELLQLVNPGTKSKSLEEQSVVRTAESPQPVSETAAERVPPPPGIQLNDAGQVGKPAFKQPLKEPVRAPRDSGGLESDDEWFSPPPPPPPQHGSQASKSAGLSAFVPPPPPPRAGTHTAGAPTGVGISPSMGSAPGAIDALELEGLVRTLVEEYCAKHFSPLAREVITSEIRRLTDERSRHLIDN